MSNCVRMLNIATESKLADSLSSILPMLDAAYLATKIVARRERLGPFRKMSELLAFDGLDQPAVAKIEIMLDTLGADELSLGGESTPSGTSESNVTGMARRDYLDWFHLDGVWASSWVEENEVDGKIRVSRQPTVRTSVPVDDAVIVNSISAGRIQTLIGCSRSEAEIVVAARPYRRPEDLITNNALSDAFDVIDIERMMDWFDTRTAIAARQPGEVVAADEISYGTVASVRQLDKDAYRVCLSASSGIEIVSADVMDDGIDERTFRLLGHLPHQLARLTEDGLAQVVKTFFGVEAWRAGQVWRDHASGLLPSKFHQPIALLSRHTQTLIHMCGAPRGLYDLRGFPSNGCTVVPDFNFRKCCEEHDACYNMGGDEAARKACDDRLWECIKNVYGHSVRARLYYWGVRLLGRWAFEWDNDPTGAVVEAKIERPLPQGPPGLPGLTCVSVVKLERVTYSGKDVGSDLQFEIIAELMRQLRDAESGKAISSGKLPRRLLRHGGSREWPIARDGQFAKQGGLTVWQNSQEPAQCGETMAVPIQITELGSADGSFHVLKFTCDAAFKTASLVLPLSSGAVFKFDFFIFGACAAPGTQHPLY